jgi:RNA polymerase sigma-70 factor (ECF subfamily)
MKRATVHTLRDVSAPERAPEETDADLIKRLAGGDLSPLGVLYDRHHEGVRLFVLRATAGGPDADDVTHEAFLTLAKIAARYDGRASARPFLLGIAAQLVRRRRRGLMRWAQALTTFGNAGGEQRVRTPEEDASVSQEMRRFDAALAKLTEEKRIVFLLVEREGLSGEEVARAVEIPVNTVWTRLHHARNELRRALSGERER